MNMTHFSLPQLPESQQESGSTLCSQKPKHRSPFQYFIGKFLGPRPSLPLCFQESSDKFGYLVSLPEQLEKMHQKGKTILLWYTNNTQEVATVREGEDWGGCVKTRNIQNHSSRQPFSKGETVLPVKAAPNVCKDSLTQKETLYPVCSLICTLNNSIKEMAKAKVLLLT